MLLSWARATESQAAAQAEAQAYAKGKGSYAGINVETVRQLEVHTLLQTHVHRRHEPQWCGECR